MQERGGGEEERTIAGVCRTVRGDGGDYSEDGRDGEETVAVFVHQIGNLVGFYSSGDERRRHLRGRRRIQVCLLLLFDFYPFFSGLIVFSCDGDDAYGLWI